MSMQIIAYIFLPTATETVVKNSKKSIAHNNFAPQVIIMANKLLNSNIITTELAKNKLLVYVKTILWAS